MRRSARAPWPRRTPWGALLLLLLLLRQRWRRRALTYYARSFANVTIIGRTCASTGRILKPDVPATAIDKTFAFRAFGAPGPDGEVWFTSTVLGVCHPRAYGFARATMIY